MSGSKPKKATKTEEGPTGFMAGFLAFGVAILLVWQAHPSPAPHGASLQIADTEIEHVMEAVLVYPDRAEKRCPINYRVRGCQDESTSTPSQVRLRAIHCPQPVRLTLSQNGRTLRLSWGYSLPQEPDRWTCVYRVNP